MFKISYLAQISLLVIWVVVVMALFRLIPDRQIAATIAGAGFILLPSAFLFSELSHTKHVWHLFTLGFFLAMSAFPIFGLRVLNWGVEFDTLSILGVPAYFLHKISSYLYFLIILSAVYYLIQERKKNRGVVAK
ncbi:hypothetical protein K2P97_13400 [bacterium]|nr:hypothetical protein [bacterium]